jgi:hypothetical protein
MEFLNTIELMRQYAKTTSKFCMYISWNEEDLYTELMKAAPYLKGHEIAILSANSHIVLIFDTEKEMVYCFNQTVGDDGPTKLNDYEGLTRVYALTCSDKGELWNENT